MEMTFVKGRRKNLVKVGWENFTLQVEFRGGRRYLFGGVPEEVKDKLLRSPFPDNLWSQLKAKNHWVSERLFTPPSKPVPPPSFDLELPF